MAKIHPETLKFCSHNHRRSTERMTWIGPPSISENGTRAPPQLDATAEGAIARKSEPDTGLTEYERYGQRQQAEAGEENGGIERTLAGFLRRDSRRSEQCSEAGHI